jgi:hypothetical protein
MSKTEKSVLLFSIYVELSQCLTWIFARKLKTKDKIRKRFRDKFIRLVSFFFLFRVHEFFVTGNTDTFIVGGYLFKVHIGTTRFYGSHF